MERRYQPIAVATAGSTSGAATATFVYEPPAGSGSVPIVPVAAGHHPFQAAQVQAGAMGPVGGPAPPSPAPNGPQLAASQPPPVGVLVGAPPPPPPQQQPGPPHPQMITATAMPPNLDENYCLRWNEYEKKYAETFRLLRDDEFFTDVTLSCDAHSVKAHRVILSACSSYFHSILKDMSPWQHPVLLLTEVRPQDLNSLMDFMYFGQVSVTQDSLQSFLKVAQKLKIKGLCEPPAVSVPDAHLGHAPLPPPVMAPPPTHTRIAAQPGAPQPGPPAPVMSPHGQGPPPALPPGTVAGGPPGPPPSVTANIEGLLPRSPYIPAAGEPSIVPLSGGQTVVSAPTMAIARPAITSAAPPVAHQSPRQMTRGAPPRASTEAIIHYSTPKRPKYATVMSPQSILRNQLSLKEGGAVGAVNAVQGASVAAGASAGANGGSGSEIEVKSEPMILATHETEVPSSAVTEFITTHENDLALTTLGHGISPQFMFSPDPAGENPGSVPVSAATAAGGAVIVSGPSLPAGGEHAAVHGNVVPPPGALVTIDDKTVRLGPASAAASVEATSPQVTSAASSAPPALPPHASSTPGVTVAGPPTPTPPSSQPQPQLHSNPATPHMHTHLHPPPPPPPLPATPVGHPSDEPQDLTPGPGQDSPSPGANGGSASSASANNISLQSTPTSSANNSLVGSPSATPPKKDRNTRKTCGYCHKDFHEMSLKRHIKDVHFRSQNTYVICPQCCKQYASQNSLYSHLNRVHGVKKDVIQGMELQMVQSGAGAAAAAGAAEQEQAQQQQPAAAAAGNNGQASAQGGGSGSGSGTHTPTGDNSNQEGIMDLAQHSDSN